MRSNVINGYAHWRHLWPAAILGGAAAIYGWAVFLSTFHHPGSIGFDYIAPGTDWMVLYGAIRLALTGHFALTIDSNGFTDYVNTTFAHFLPHPMFYRPWVYPPAFLIVLLPFGLLGFVASYAAFQIAGAALLGGALLYRPDRPAAAKWVALAALLCPAASINVVDGQCGFLVAGLLVLGFRLLTARPLLAGMVLGLGCVKPQFGLMVPVALIAVRQWRGVLGACLSGAGLALASAAAFGVQPWLWWVDLATTFGNAGTKWSSSGRMWGSSVFTCAELLHAPPVVSQALQAAAMALAGGLVYRAWRLPLPLDRRLAILLAASILAAPHSGTYDMTLLAVAGALWLASLTENRTGARSGPRTTFPVTAFRVSAPLATDPTSRPVPPAAATLAKAPSLAHAILFLLLWLAPMLAPPALVPVGRAEPLLVVWFLVVAGRPLLRGGIPAPGGPRDIAAWQPG